MRSVIISICRHTEVADVIVRLIPVNVVYCGKVQEVRQECLRNEAVHLKYDRLEAMKRSEKKMLARLFDALDKFFG